MPIIKQKGFDFCFDPGACADCRGYCCRGSSGHVWLGEQDVRSIGDFLNMNSIDFIQRFTDRVNNRLSLKEVCTQGDHSCIFFDNDLKGCRIYEVRPDQCRRFPFWDYFRGRKAELVGECPGVRDCTEKEV